MKVYVENYGCAANRNNAEQIISLALGAGHEYVSKETKADIIIINTCTVKHLTEQKILYRIKELKGKNVVVTGCMIPLQEKKVRNIYPNIVTIAWNELEKFKDIFGEPYRNIHFSFDNLTKIVQISVGCVGNCSYCIVKKIKNQLISKNIDEIIKEIKEGLKHGAKEIYLTSTDTAAYGFDKGTNLAYLLRYILEEVKGEYKIRIGMMNPVPFSRFYKDLIPLFKDPKLYKFLHIPVQSGSEKVLKEMNRPTDLNRVLEIKRAFHEVVGDLGFIATDIIVGYPTETSVDFEETKRFLQLLLPDMTHVSKYGPRDFTEAKKLKPLPSQVVKSRSRELSMLARKIALERNRKWIGRITEVLVLYDSGEIASGRNDYYKMISFKKNEYERIEGKVVKVRIKDASPSHLIGELM